MYKIFDAFDIKKDIEEFKKIDKDIPIIENAIYVVFTEEKEIIGYIVAIQNFSEYVLQRIYIKKEKRYRSCGFRLLSFFISHGIKKKKEVIKCPCSDIDNFLKKARFKKLEENMVLNIIEEKNRKKDGTTIAGCSVILNIFLAIIKIFGGIKGHSKALIADGVNSLSDVITSIAILLGIHFSNIPGDEEHPYGHEKIESIIGNMVGLFIVITSFEIIRNAFADILNGRKSLNIDIGTIYIALLSAVIKYGMYYYKMKIGKETKNFALIADARDSKSDIFSSLGVVVGIGLSIYISPIFDNLVTILVGILIFKEGILTIFETSNTILDKQEEEFIKKIEDYIYKNTSIKNVHDIYMRRSGDKIFLTMHVRVDKNMTVFKAHCMTDALEESIIMDFEEVKAVMVHIDYFMN